MRSRRIAIVLGLAGAGVVLLAGSRDWYVLASTTSQPALPAVGKALVGKALTGTDFVPVLPGLALMGAAAAGVLGTAGRAVRMVAAALLLLAGAATIAAVLTTDYAGPVESRFGISQSARTALTNLFWPSVAVVGSVLMVVAGIVGLVLSRRWPAPTRRYERAGSGPSAPASAPDGTSGTPGTSGTRADLDDWTSLSQGHDPT